MTGFESPFPVAVSQVGPREWALTAPLNYTDASGRTFRVPIGQTTDFASVPLVLTWLVPVTTGIAAAVLHDFLWRCEAPHRISYRNADRTLREALGTLGVSGARRWLMWAAVRWGALTTRWRLGGSRGWWRDAPAVVGISLLALPAAVASLVLLPFLVLFKVVEAVTG